MQITTREGNIHQCTQTQSFAFAYTGRFCGKNAWHTVSALTEHSKTGILPWNWQANKPKNLDLQVKHSTSAFLWPRERTEEFCHFIKCSYCYEYWKKHSLKFSNSYHPICLSERMIILSTSSILKIFLPLCTSVCFLFKCLLTALETTTTSITTATTNFISPFLFRFT